MNMSATTAGIVATVIPVLLLATTLERTFIVRVRAWPLAANVAASLYVLFGLWGVMAALLAVEYGGATGAHGTMCWTTLVITLLGQLYLSAALISGVLREGEE